MEIDPEELLQEAREMALYLRFLERRVALLEDQLATRPLPEPDEEGSEL